MTNISWINLIYDGRGPCGLNPSVYQNIASGLLGSFITAVIIGGLAGLAFRWFTDWRMRPVRRRAAQLLWSCAVNASVASQAIIEGTSDDGKEKPHFESLVILFEWSISNLQNFFQDHAPILPPNTFSFASELRGNAEFARLVLTSACSLEDTDLRYKLQLRYFACNGDGSNELEKLIGLKELGLFLTYSVLPICKALGTPNPPSSLPDYVQRSAQGVDSHEAGGKTYENPEQNSNAQPVVAPDR